MGNESEEAKTNLRKISDLGRKMGQDCAGLVEKSEYAQEIIEISEKNGLKSSEPVQTWIHSVCLDAFKVFIELKEADIAINSVCQLIGTHVSTGTSATILSATHSTTALGHCMSSPLIYKNQSIDDKELEGYLKTFQAEFNLSRNFVSEMHGAWDVFYSGSRDRLKQASDSMRYIFSQLIAVFAPNEILETLEWCKKLTDSKGNRQFYKAHRVQYMLFGSTGKQTSSMADPILADWDALEKCYEDLQHIGHGKEGDENKVKACLVATQKLMLAIFQARNVHQEGRGHHVEGARHEKR